MSRKRQSVKQLSRNNSLLDRIREECVERYGRDRELLRERIRKEIEISNEPYDEIDIDKFVEDFLADQEDEEIDQVFPSDWVWCPICISGFLVCFEPGLVVCENCQEFKLCVSESNFNFSNFAQMLDHAIRSHSENRKCDQRPTFSITNNSTLNIHCNSCSFSSIVL